MCFFGFLFSKLEATLAFVFLNLEGTLVFGIGIIVIGMMLRNLSVEMTEHAPSPVHLDQWNAEYHGQHWITLTGIAKREWSNQLPGSKEQPGHIFIPVVASNYHDGDTIHAVIVAEPNHAPGSGPITVEGCVDGWNASKALPGLPIDPSAVWLSLGAKPVPSTTAIGGVAIGLVFALIGSSRLRGAWRERRQ